MSDMLTMEQIEEALEDGDFYCKNCGYRKSLHGDHHPTAHLRNGGCAKFAYSYFFNEMQVDEEWLKKGSKR